MNKSDIFSSIANDEYLAEFYGVAYRQLNSIIGTPVRSERSMEIGSGLGFARLSGHCWLHSDLVNSESLDLRTCAEQLPFKDGSLDALILKDTWHHISDIERFLEEAHRVLRVGGSIAVFDPYWGLLARFVYRFLHQERWDSRIPNWSFDSTDPWDSNQALTYIMLRRDRQDFDDRWGSQFAVTEYRRHIGPSFLISGGVSRRTPVSGKLLKHLLVWEEHRGDWFNHFRFFHVFGLVKR